MKACLIGTPFELAAEHIAMRDPLRIAARPFARALVQAATRSGDHLSNPARGRALAANGLCRAPIRQTSRGDLAKLL